MATSVHRYFGPFFSNGVLVDAPLLYHYVPGTSQEKTAWEDYNRNITAANPIEGDANGLIAGYFAGLYKIRITTSDGAIVLASWDNVNFIATEEESASDSDVINIKDFGAGAADIIDDTDIIQAALDTGKDVLIPPGTFTTTGPLLLRHNRQRLFGYGRSSIIKNISSAGIFCAIGIVEHVTGVSLHDFTLLGNATSEPLGPAPVRGIVCGTNNLGSDHSAVSWDARTHIHNLYISGITPGSSGFNVGIQFNKANKSLMENCIIDSLYGTNGNYGYGVVCHGDDIDLVNVRTLATIPGQGRHGFYLTSAPNRVRVINGYAEGFQSEPFTTNISSGGEGLEFINCISKDSAISAIGTHDAVFAFHGGSKGRIVGCRAYGATRSSNNFGITVKDHDYVTVSDIYMERVDRHGVYIDTAHYGRFQNIHMNLVGTEDVAQYGGLTIVQSNYVDVDGLTITGPGRFVARFDSSSPQPANCRIRHLLYSGSFAHVIENYSINTGSNLAFAKQLPLVARADLAAAASAMDGQIVIDDNGAGDRNLVFYSGGQRFRVDGGSNV